MEAMALNVIIQTNFKTGITNNGKTTFFVRSFAVCRLNLSLVSLSRWHKNLKRKCKPHRTNPFIFVYSRMKLYINRSHLIFRTTIPEKIFATKWRNSVNLDKKRFLCVFQLLLLKFNFLKGDWVLGYVFTQIWNFSLIS